MRAADSGAVGMGSSQDEWSWEHLTGCFCQVALAQAEGLDGRHALRNALGGSGLGIWRVVRVHSKASTSCVGVCGAFIPMVRHSTGGSKWR